MSKKAALYLRSSKDRSEMSLDAQRDELKSLALKNGLEITASFEDAVYSGASDDRPGFQDLIAALKSRTFDHLLVYDTSRIARSVLIAQVFKRECERHGVRILYASTPIDLDPITSVLLNSVYEAFDQMHSMMSRKKGLAGMRQNITKGWRAGGRAPLGYRLLHEPTGGMRDGRPVMKSKLALSEDADLVARYLKARATLEPRAAVVKRLGISWPFTTLVAVDWNALVYAGHTVWNRHREKKSRGSGLTKRRDRGDWVVQRNTHPALITELEAEAIIAQMMTSKIGEAVRNAKTHASTFLLAGLLVTRDGRAWVGAGPRYRLKPTAEQRGRYVDRLAIEEAVVAQVRQDIADEGFIGRLTAATREWYPESDPGQDLEKQAQRLEREADRAAKLALETSEPGPFISLMEAKRRQAESVRRQAGAARRDEEVLRTTRAITRETVREALSQEQSDAALVRSLVAKVVLEPDLSCRIDYLPAISRSLSMASPRHIAEWAISSKVAAFG